MIYSYILFDPQCLYKYLDINILRVIILPEELELYFLLFIMDELNCLLSPRTYA